MFGPKRVLVSITLEDNLAAGKRLVKKLRIIKTFQY